MTINYSSVTSLIRWGSWSDTKLVFLFISLGIVTLEKPIADLQEQFLILLKFSILFIAYGSFVSIINDFWDIHIDKEAKKLRGVMRLHNMAMAVILLILLSIYVFLLILLAHRRAAVSALGIVMVLSGFFYSSPPIRLKERGWLGIVSGSLIQRSLPLLLVFIILKNLTPTASLLVVLTFILGLKLMLIHQTEDYSADLRSKMKTVITNIGIERGKKIIQYLFFLEILVLSAFLLLIHRTMLIHLIVFAYLAFWSLLLAAKPDIKHLIDNFSMNDFFMSDFYYVWLPLYIGIVILLKNGNPLLLLILLPLQKKHIRIFLRKISY